MAGYVGDMLINAILVMSIYGWYKCVRKPQKEDNLPITRTNKKEKIIGIVLFIVTIFLLGFTKCLITRFITRII
jgi:nicotinamide mononucleotide transporter